MRYRLLIFFLFLTSLSVGQVNTDSIRSIWASESNEIEDRLDAMYYYSTIVYLRSNPDSAFLLANEMYDLAQHALDSNTKLTPGVVKKYQKILDNKEMLQLNYNVMQLSDVDISQQSKDVIRKLWERKPNTFGKINMKRMLYQDGLHSINNRFDDWSRVFLKLALIGRKI